MKSHDCVWLVSHRKSLPLPRPLARALCVSCICCGLPVETPGRLIPRPHAPRRMAYRERPRFAALTCGACASLLTGELFSAERRGLWRAIRQNAAARMRDRVALRLSRMPRGPRQARRDWQREHRRTETPRHARQPSHCKGGTLDGAQPRRSPSRIERAGRRSYSVRRAR
jgi:hypothetical protein